MLELTDFVLNPRSLRQRVQAKTGKTKTEVNRLFQSFFVLRLRVSVTMVIPNNRIRPLQISIEVLCSAIPKQNWVVLSTSTKTAVANRNAIEPRNFLLSFSIALLILSVAPLPCLPNRMRGDASDETPPTHAISAATQSIAQACQAARSLTRPVATQRLSALDYISPGSSASFCCTSSRIFLRKLLTTLRGRASQAPCALLLSHLGCGRSVRVVEPQKFAGSIAFTVCAVVVFCCFCFGVVIWCACTRLICCVVAPSPKPPAATLQAQ